VDEEKYAGLSVKDEIRRRIWNLMDELGISRFPRPAAGRIPNFVGAERAAWRLIQQPEFHEARVVKVNPDSPQALVRKETLLGGKILIMPTPRLRRGFIILNPREIPRRSVARASTIKGAFKYGRIISLNDLPKVDLIVAGSVAVSRDGVRVGKGGGYSELEYGILRELGKVDEKTPIFTTVHDIQIIDWAPSEPHDLIVDAIITPTKVIRIRRRAKRPAGIMWERITPNMLRDMPILLELALIKGIDLNQTKPQQ